MRLLTVILLNAIVIFFVVFRYDVFVTKEPDVFEAMALVHSRVRRVIFGCADTECGGLGGTGQDTAVNSLPGTNHHYSVYRCVSEGIATECSSLL